MVELPPSWQAILGEELGKPYFTELQRFVDEERRCQEVYPAETDVFNALRYTPFEKVSVVLLGQDPYHDVGQAHGLCFSVPHGVACPPSLANIFRELQDDIGCPVPAAGCLIPWAEQGVLLLNAVLTVRAHEPNCHKSKGWEKFTDAIIRKVSEKKETVVYLLWGNYAQKKSELIDRSRHTIIATAHPSPLSARRGFFGSRPFSLANQALISAGRTPIDWRLP
jgi:uracil-DNA glycosylase